ncbi:MAG: iron chelate uptake ABC transporter family permease subunit [Castellaniella sp.]|uniref:FecCD family ABC transporter permease n=1 Tax=Castellaniella sp. TaxID=1955812 RepID=UPI003C7218A4
MSTVSYPVSPPVCLLALGGCLALALLAASASGPVPIPWDRLPQLLWGALMPGDTLLRQVLIDIRLPRALFSAAVGAALALAGAVIQALFRNPLAEPGLVGISSGAALGAVLAIVLAAGGAWLIMAAAFLGSLAATFLAYAIGRRQPGVAGILLAGIAINTACGSLIGLLTYAANDAQLRDLTFWSMGSLSGADWTVLAWAGPWTLGLLVYLCRQWRVLNALLLGEREAAHLGFELVSVRRRLIVAVSLLVGPLVAVSGGIGFVGLVVPHVVRMALGAHHRFLLPACVLGGALVLVLADWLSRVLLSPAELPIGLVTSLVGGPFFFWLLLRGGQDR